MKHKTEKYKSPTAKQKERLDVFVLTQDFGKFRRGEIFEEFYNRTGFYSIFSRIFDINSKSGHTKIIRFTKNAPVSFFQPIKKAESMLYQLHTSGLENISQVRYKAK